MALTGNWVPVPSTDSGGQRLQQQFRADMQQLAQIAANMQARAKLLGGMAPSTDVTTIETVFNLAAGQGQTFKNVLTSASNDLNGINGGSTFIQQLLQNYG